MKSKFVLLLFLSLFALTSCVGQKGTETQIGALVKLTTDKQSFDVDKEESIHFTVFADGEDVTSKSKIINITDGAYEQLDGTTFTTLRPGSYVFSAEYGSVMSEPFPIRAISSSSLSENFYRRNMVIKFTGTWCTYCPQMSKAIKMAEKERPNRIIEIAVHNNDQLTVSVGTQMFARFKPEGLPVAVVDFDKTLSLSQSLSSLILRNMDLANERTPVGCGIKVDTKLDGSLISVDVEATIVQSGHYYMAVALLVDGYSYAQVGTSDPDYRQNSVLRTVAKGDDMGEDLGNLTKSERVRKSYELQIDNDIDPSRCRVVVYLLRNNEESKAFLLSNIVNCDAGKSIGYEFEQKTAPAPKL